MEFRKVKLGDYIETISDTTPINKEKVILINTSDVENGYVLNHSYVENKNLKGQFKKRFKKGDILYSEIRPKNRRFAYIDFDAGDYIASTKLMVIRNKGNINNDFLFQLLKSDHIINHLQMLAETRSGTFPQITFNELSNLEIFIPTLRNQEKISKILNNIDKKIELNNQINDNLHKLLKNIYYNTFIVNRREDWTKAKLGNYLKVERGLSYKGKFLSDNGTPMINLGNVMPDGVFRLEKNKYYTGEYKEKATANAGDIVIANTDMTQNREVIGTPVIIPSLYKEKVIFSHHIYGLKNLKLPKMYVFYSLLTDEWNGIAGGSATGTTVLALPKDAIEEYMITIPDEITLNKFEKLAENIQNQREQIILENIKLEQLRDTLLPKLMNGEIDLDKIEI